MSHRSFSTIDRDHTRAINHKVHQRVLELSTIDWISVERYEIQEYLEELKDLESECESERMCEKLEEIISDLEELLG